MSKCLWSLSLIFLPCKKGEILVLVHRFISTVHQSYAKCFSKFLHLNKLSLKVSYDYYSNCWVFMGKKELWFVPEGLFYFPEFWIQGYFVFVTMSKESRKSHTHTYTCTQLTLLPNLKYFLPSILHFALIRVNKSEFWILAVVKIREEITSDWSNRR